MQNSIHGEKIDLSQKEYDELADYIYATCGIDLGDNKLELLKARLMKRLRFHKLSSYAEYYHYLRNNDKGGDELTEMINAISTNVTSFFREKQHFDFMVTHALPDIIRRKRKNGDRELRIWSSASATGEEVYSIALTTLSVLEQYPEIRVRILGTDISTKALTVAQQGVYEQAKVAHIPPKLRQAYMTEAAKSATRSYVMKPEVKSCITFARLNLMSPTFPFKKKFDIIFCRNVMIYFDNVTQETLVNKFHRYLDSDGYLLIGHSESLLNADIKFKRIATATFKKL